MKQVALVLFVIAMILPTTLLAEQVRPEEARLAGENFLEYKIGQAGGDRSALPDTDEFEEVWRDGRLLAYLITLEPQGHILLSPIRELPAVKSYSLVTDFDPDHEDGYSAMVLEVMEQSLTFLEENYGSLANLPVEAAPLENRESWRRYLAGGMQSREETEMVGPLISATWHQSGPYNNDCPQGDGGTCVVGCVATTAAMIMHYWRYPEFGEGSTSYYWPGDDSCGGSSPGENLTANFSDPYDWDNILDSYSGGYTPEQAAAVAELNYEAGVAFNMDYGVCGSGCYVSTGAFAYPTYFRYSESATFVHRNENTADSWFDLIRAELDAFPARVMHYRINGHSILCDGYEVDGEAKYYHMNYGWGGGSNAWYALDNLYCPWDGCNYMVEAMVSGIEPLGLFPVYTPTDDTIWTTGESVPEITWAVSGGAEVVIDLYNEYTFVTRLASWTPNDGTEIIAGTVMPEWGTGSRFRVKVIDSEEKFGWSEYFGIYGSSAWTDITTPPLNSDLDGQTAAWVDINNDHLLDLYVCNKNGENLVCLNQGAGNFNGLATTPLNSPSKSIGSAWADIDNDGDLDLYVANSTGQANHLIRNDQPDGFTEITAGPLFDEEYSHDIAWGDYDNDGLVDLYVVDVYTEDKLFHNEGDGVFTLANSAPIGDAGHGRSPSWADIDNDGDLDLYLTRNATNRLYRNDGAGVFSEIYGTPLNENGNTYGAAWGDYDNDGDLDVYLVNGGANRLVRNDGGTFVDVTVGPLGNAGDGRGSAWGDFDNDGWLDLYVANRGDNMLLHNLNGVFYNETSPLLINSDQGQGVAWGDIDGDGDLDLYISNSTDPNRLFQNDNQDGNHWLHLNLEGRSSNRSAYGARVTIHTGEEIQYRQVGGDAGYVSRNSLTVEFGLGAVSVVDSIRIDWPLGEVQVLTNVLADQVIDVLEPGATAVEPVTAASFNLAVNYPNPFNPETEISFTLPGATVTSLGVYDLSGRLVKKLVDSVPLSAGTHSERWDGRDRTGRAMASGVYLYRLDAGDYSSYRKMTLLK